MVPSYSPVKSTVKSFLLNRILLNINIENNNNSEQLVGLGICQISKACVKATVNPLVQHGQIEHY